jgi:electron transfer flavoprotein beta subunit
MRILVCIKQVPASSNVEVDPITGVLMRSRTDNKLNPYDLFAIEAALRIRQEAGGRVSVMTMGPPQAEETLAEAVYMGADDGYLLTDAGFAGSDVLATSYALSQGIRKAGGFDLILCGKQTTDGDTAQVGAEVAEFLQIPHAALVSRIAQVEPDTLDVWVNFELSVARYRMRLPCLLCVDNDVNTPRLPSFRRQLEIGRPPLVHLSIADLEDGDPFHYGIHGSPTLVESIYPPEKNLGRRVLEGSGDELAAFLFNLLKRDKYVKEAICE